MFLPQSKRIRFALIQSILQNHTEWSHRLYFLVFRSKNKIFNTLQSFIKSYRPISCHVQFFCVESFLRKVKNISPTFPDRKHGLWLDHYEPKLNFAVSF
jgi:hypothetical protein